MLSTGCPGCGPPRVGVHGDGGIDHGEVGEGLREVTDLFALATDSAGPKLSDFVLKRGEHQSSPRIGAEGGQSGSVVGGSVAKAEANGRPSPVSARAWFYTRRRPMQPVQSTVEAASLVMRNGASTVAAEHSFTNIVTGYGLQGVTVIWRLDFIAASSTVDGESATVVRSVGPIGVNLIRAAEVAALSERVAKGEVELPVLDAEIARVQKMPIPYNRWLTVLAAAIIGAGLSQFAGGDWGSLPVAAVAAGVGQIPRSAMQAKKHPAATVTLICGLLSAGIASAALRLGFSDVPSVNPDRLSGLFGAGSAVDQRLCGHDIAQISARGNRADHQRGVPVHPPGDLHCAGLHGHYLEEQ